MAGLFDNLDPVATAATQRYGVNVKSITRGTLLSFHYPHSMAVPPTPIHDTYPLIIVTDVWPKFIRGVNLHYLTFPYIKRLLEAHGEKSSASYSSIRGDTYVAQSFRMYNRLGIQQPRKLDVEFLKVIMREVRNFSPNEIERIRNQIEAQIQKRLQVRAEELSTFENAKKEATARSENWNQFRSSLSSAPIQKPNASQQQNPINPQQGTGRPMANTPPQPGQGVIADAS